MASMVAGPDSGGFLAVGLHKKSGFQIQVCWIYVIALQMLAIV